VIDRAVQGQVKVTVIATGFMRDEARAPAFRPVAGTTVAADTVDEAPLTEDPAREPRFVRRRVDGTFDFDATDDGMTPNFAKLKDDLDVPAFLRKQMD
jgi:hypothetical protein